MYYNQKFLLKVDGQSLFSGNRKVKIKSKKNIMTSTKKPIRSLIDLCTLQLHQPSVLLDFSEDENFSSEMKNRRTKDVIDI